MFSTLERFIDQKSGLSCGILRHFLIHHRSLTYKRRHDVRDTAQSVLPRVRHGVLEVEHHARRPRVEHLHHEFRLIGGTGHLVTLIHAPHRHLDLPLAFRGLAGGQVGGQRTARMGCRESRDARSGKHLRSRGELTMQGCIEVEEAGRQVTIGGSRGGRVHAALHRQAALPDLIRSLASCLPVGQYARAALLRASLAGAVATYCGGSVSA